MANSLGHPQFFTSSSPIVVDGLCIAQFGGESKGGIAAYDMADGKEKWKWSEDGTAYASPVLLTVDGAKMIVGRNGSKHCWPLALRRQIPLEDSYPKGQGRSYNASTR